MSEFKGTKGKWSIEEGWVDQHVSISSPAHGAIAQVLIEMEDTTTPEKKEELKNNAKVMVIAPELFDLVSKIKSNETAYNVLKAVEPTLCEEIDRLICFMKS
ncbi:hypothetical protein ACTOJ1_001428 [Shigella flexneri]